MIVNVFACKLQKRNLFTKKIRMKKNLTKKELAQFIGGSEIEESDLSENTTENSEFAKRNTNRTEFCRCKYINMSSITNSNREYACVCTYTL